MVHLHGRALCILLTNHPTQSTESSSTVNHLPDSVLLHSWHTCWQAHIDRLGEVSIVHLLRIYGLTEVLN